MGGKKEKNGDVLIGVRKKKKRNDNFFFTVF
jgi:hypothetical protein